MLHYATRKINNIEHFLMFYVIENLYPIFAPCEDTTGLHHVQVTGGIRLFFSYSRKDFADTFLSVAEKINDFQPVGWAEPLEFRLYKWLYRS
jgi:hypothetical protein